MSEHYAHQRCLLHSSPVPHAAFNFAPLRHCVEFPQLQPQNPTVKMAKKARRFSAPSGSVNWFPFSPKGESLNPLNRRRRESRAYIRLAPQTSSATSAPSHESFFVKAKEVRCLWYLTNLPFALVPSTAH